MWKVNDTLFKGRVNVWMMWCRMVAKAHELVRNAIDIVKQDVPIEMRNIKNIPGRLFSLFFGKKSMKTTYDVDYAN